jgi:hypothetical protein
MTSAKEMSELKQAIAQLEQEIQTRQQRLDTLKSAASVSPVAVLSERLASVRAAIETQPESQALSAEIAILQQDLEQKNAKLALWTKEAEAEVAEQRLEAEIPRLSAISAELNQASDELLARFRAFESEVKALQQATGRSGLMEPSRVGFPRVLVPENMKVTQQDFFAVYCQGEVFFADDLEGRYFRRNNAFHWLERSIDSFGHARYRLFSR